MRAEAALAAARTARSRLQAHWTDHRRGPHILRGLGIYADAAVQLMQSALNC